MYRTSRLPTAGSANDDHQGIVQRVDATLARALEGERRALLEVDPALEPVADAARQLVLGGGKRLRSTFTYWGWRGAGEPDADVPISAGAALELLHAFALAHDDVMDGDDVRRGMPSLHARFASGRRSAARNGDSGSRGRAVAILIGDLLAVWADRVLGDCGASADRTLATRRLYDTMRAEVIAGQYLDVAGEDRSTAGALRIARHKSASYTVARPLQIGGTLAGAPPALLRAYWNFGIAVGEGFQLRDDLLGVYGSTERTGKPVGGDLRQDKPTVLASVALQRATPSQRRTLLAGLGDRDLDEEDVGRLAQVITDTGAATVLESMIAERLDDAGVVLEGAPVDSAVRRSLLELARAATVRER